MRHLRIKNWREFQHYARDKATPPWIKFYNGLFVDENYCALHDLAKLTLTSVWLLASTVILNDDMDDPWIPEVWLNSHDLRMQSKPRINDIVAAGFAYWESRRPSRPVARRDPRKPSRPETRKSPLTTSSSESCKSLVLLEGGAGGSPGIDYLQSVLRAFGCKPCHPEQVAEWIATYPSAEWLAVAVAEKQTYVAGKGSRYLSTMFAERQSEGWTLPEIDAREYVDYMIRKRSIA